MKYVMMMVMLWRAVGRPVQNRAGTNGGFHVKQQQVKVVTKHQRPQTLDSLFANMKEQRMKVLSQQHQNINTGGRRFGPGQQRPRPPWTRSYNN
ncbi:hypothetical protein L2E82_47839 [Cichorium intybus]|uniref:Uncharacterized protein n=1 Tax=Cichorium intybus TaxID=13427 RepID=A0ACB8YWV6_CICIN|nr:hypothetical protein L2E82_47839 [Cichorium intybus]